MKREIEKRLAKLDALENGGVDNWEFYSEALSDYFSIYERVEKIERFVDEILEICSKNCEEPAGRGAGYGIRVEAQHEVLRLALDKIKELK